MSFYLIIRGPLGVGKTTVARRVATALGAEYLSVDQILNEPGVEEWDGGYISERSFRRVNELAVPRVLPALQRGVPVVFDGNFYWQGQIDDLVRRLSFPQAVITLTAPLALCIERDAARSPSYGAEAARDVYAKSAEVRSGVPIDATAPLEQVVQAVLAQRPLSRP